MLGLIGLVVFGFIVGLVARAVMPGEQRMGIIMTTLLGIGGSIAGSAIGHALFHGPHYGNDGASFIGSVIGALAILFVGSLLRGKRRS